MHIKLVDFGEGIIVRVIKLNLILERVLEEVVICLVRNRYVEDLVSAVTRRLKNYNLIAQMEELHPLLKVLLIY